MQELASSEMFMSNLGCCGLIGREGGDWSLNFSLLPSLLEHMYVHVWTDLTSNLVCERNDINYYYCMKMIFYQLRYWDHYCQPNYRHYHHRPVIIIKVLLCGNKICITLFVFFSE